MAITQTGSTQRFTWTFGAANAATLSSTITVPSDAQIAVAALSSYNASATYFSTGSLTLTKSSADTAMTLGPAGSSTASWQGFMWYLALPDTGTNKSLKYDWAGAGTASDDAVLTLRFYTGIDTASPVRDSDVIQSATLPHTTPTLTAQTGDLIVACDSFFCGGTNGTINTWSNLTLSEQITNNTNADQSWAHGSPSGNTTVASSTGTNAAEGCLCAIVLKPAAASTTDGVGSSAGTAAAAAVGSALATLVPDADITDGSWLTDTGGTSLFAAIDETVASDTDYIVSGTPDSDMCEIRLSDPGFTLARPFSVAYRYKRIGTDTPTLRVQLMEGATSRASWDVAVSSSTFTDGEQFLTAPEFASIVDFTDLRVRLTAIRESSLTLEGDFSGDLTLEGDFSGSLLLEGS